MKILIISNLYPSLQSPHYGSFVKNFEDQLRSDSRVNSLKGVFLKGIRSNIVTKVLAYIIFYLKIFYYLIFHSYDLVYIHLITHSTIPVRIVSYFRTLKLVFNIHGEDLLVVNERSKILLNLALPLIYKAKFIVVPSNYFKNLTKQLLPRLNQDKVIISASAGVKKRFYTDKGKSIEYRKSNTFGFVSRIDRGKGWDTLIDALVILKNKGIMPNVEIVGDGPEKNKLLNLLEKEKLSNVKYVGAIPHDNLPDFYKSLDVFIFPTKLRESLGLVGLEAMASGVPVIGSNIGGLMDYIKDNNNGFFFNPNDPKDLADKIVHFINLDDKTKEKLRYEAYKTALNYKAEKVSKDLFDKILLK